MPKVDSVGLVRSTTPLGKYLEQIREEIIALALNRVHYSLKESESVIATHSETITD